MSARTIVIAGLFAASLTVPGFAQTGQGPAELPPADFAGREYVDSQGCVFLRSTFGGQVTWVPRFGPDRQPICSGTVTLPEPQATGAPAAETPAPAPVAAAPAPAPVATPAPAPARVTSAPVAAPTPARVRTSAAPRAEPVRRTSTRAQAPRKPAPVRAAHPRGPNADGRHPDCPPNAQFGRLVRMPDGKIMVMCVVSPELFPAGQTAAHAPKATAPAATVAHAPAKPAPSAQHPAAHAPASHGRVLQAGSFRVAENAARLSARLSAQGLPVHSHRQGGLTVVTVGPFADQGQAHAALSAVRSAGIRDAFFR